MDRIFTNLQRCQKVKRDITKENTLLLAYVLRLVYTNRRVGQV